MKGDMDHSVLVSRVLSSEQFLSANLEQIFGEKFVIHFVFLHVEIIINLTSQRVTIIK